MTSGREILVGAVIIGAALLGAVGTLWLTGTNWGRPVTRVDVLVRDVGQLQEGNQVTFRGVPIGRVGGLEVEQPGGNAVRLHLELEGEVDLAGDAVVIIAPESLFGDWQAEIVSRSRFPRYNYYPVEPGRTDAGVRVLGGYAIPDISRLTATAEAVSENLAELTDRVERAFNEETAENLQRAIGNIQQVSEDIKNLIQQQASTFEEVSAEVELTTREISQSVRVARSSLERVDSILASGEIDSILVNMEATTRSAQEISRDVGMATRNLDSTLVRVDSAFARMDRLSARVEAGEGTLGRLLTDTALVTRAETVLADLDALLRDFRENPSRYVRLSIF